MALAVSVCRGAAMVDTRGPPPPPLWGGGAPGGGGGGGFPLAHFGAGLSAGRCVLSQRVRIDLMALLFPILAVENRSSVIWGGAAWCWQLLTLALVRPLLRRF